MFVDHQPIAVDLLVNVSHPYGQIRLLALLIGASDTLDAVPIGEAVVSGDVEVGQLDGDRAVEASALAGGQSTKANNVRTTAPPTRRASNVFIVTSFSQLSDLRDFRTGVRLSAP